MATEAQALIDEEIRNLWTRRNDFSLISRLPTETLASIFIYGARDYHRDCDRRHFTQTVPSWVNVCRYKQASLMLYVKLGFREKSLWLSRFVEQVTNHAERIQELRIRLPATHTLDVLSKLSSRAPRLKTLNIDFILAWRDPSEGSFVLFSGDTRAHTLSSSVAFVQAEWFYDPQSASCPCSVSTEHGGASSHA